jgi:hypothetical protein
MTRGNRQAPALPVGSWFVPLPRHTRYQGFAVSIDNDLRRRVLEICKDDYKAALRMVLIANTFYEEEIARLKNGASAGDVRKIRKPVNS